MAYSTSRKTLDRMMEHLEPMLQSRQGCTWIHDRPHHFAYKLREALYIAEMYRQDYPRLAPLGQQFEIRVELPNRVLAVPKKSSGPILKVESGGGQATPLDDRNELISVKGSQTVTMIIEAWMAGNAKKMVFPDARLLRHDLKSLYNWAQKRQLIFFHSESGLTLQIYDDDLAPFAWAPEDD